MAAPEIRTITVAIDGSTNAEEALRYATDLAKRYGAELTVVAVAPIHPVYLSPTEPWVSAEVMQSEGDHYRSIVDRSVKQAQSAGLTKVTGVCLEGVIVDELMGHLEQHPPDLFVVGSRGLSTAKRLFIGSVSEALLHHVNCPMLVVRGSATPPPGS
jgi:nucleotide-binding universal stress UspA family protein